jgi:hypothetical protein
MRLNVLTADVKWLFIPSKVKKSKWNPSSFNTNPEMIRLWIGYAIVVIVPSKEILFSFAIAVMPMPATSSAMKPWMELYQAENGIAIIVDDLLILPNIFEFEFIIDRFR